jgi:hypothetical protein
MTVAEMLASSPSFDVLDSAISMQTLQLALLEQQYVPNHPLFSKSAITATPAADLTGLNVEGSEFGSDKVTVGDTTSVCFVS